MTVLEWDHHVALIGEVGQAHDGSLGTAHAFIDAIADAGADAVKFQTHIASAESRTDEPWRVKFSYADDTRYEYWKRIEFSPQAWAGLRQHALDRRLAFMSSPFSLEAVELPAWFTKKLESISESAWRPQLIERLLKVAIPLTATAVAVLAPVAKTPPVRVSVTVDELVIATPPAAFSTAT